MSSDKQESNPYRPPEADLAVEQKIDSELASLGKRLGGAIIDAMLSLLIFFPIIFATGYWEDAMSGEVNIISTIMFGMLGFLVFVILHGYLLHTSGQTIGKRLVGTRIVSVADNKILPLGRLLALRVLPVWVASQIPLVGGLLGIIDALFIFGKDRRCVHDKIAGTKVINVAG